MKTIKVFALYADLSEPEVWKIWEDQIRLAVLAAYTRARETAGKAPLFPLEIVGELSVTLRQGDEVIRVDLPSPAPSLDRPEKPKNRNQYDIPFPPVWYPVKNGDFTLWFGKFKEKKLSSLLTEEGLNYCFWLRSQEKLPPEYRTAVNNHIRAAISARRLAQFDLNRRRI